MSNQLTQDTQSFKYLPQLSMLYIAIILLTLFVENKVVLLWNINILSGTLVLPLSYAISDIITEVYGYKIMRRTLWYSTFILYLAAGFILILLNLPGALNASQNMAYNEVLEILLKNILTYSIASLTSLFLNSYLLSKLKIFTRGKFFALRSLGSTMIGEAIFIIIWAFIGFTHTFSMHALLLVMLASYVCKIIYNLLAIIPCAILTKWLKYKEKSDVYDNGVNFNPFSMAT